MTPNLRIAIITHEIDDFENSTYQMRHLCKIWKQSGANIVIVKGTKQELPPADIAILHTDITAVGDDYIRIINHYPKVINGTVTDINKTVFSDLLVERNDDWIGKVILKTNANFGGMREREQKFHDGDFQSEIDIQRPWRRVEWLDKYPIFDSKADVPSGVWRNDKLVVERFLPEVNEQGEYILRIWLFLGDQGLYYQCASLTPIIKSQTIIRREFLDVSDVPESIRQARARLGFDYGKFDFALCEGEAALYDVNRTPGGPKYATDPDREAKSRGILSAGLDSFLI